MSAKEISDGDPISARVICQVSLRGHTLRILFKKTYNRDTSLLDVMNSIIHNDLEITPKANNPDLSQENVDKMAPVVTNLSHPSQEIPSKNLANFTLGSFVDVKSKEISLSIDFKGTPRFTDKRIFGKFVHVIARNNGDFLTTTSPKEVIRIVIDLIDVVKLQSFDFTTTLVDDIKLLINSIGDDFSKMLSSLMFPLIRICEHGQSASENTCNHEVTASVRGAGKLLTYILTEHSSTIRPYLIHLETMVGRMLKNDYEHILFTQLFPKVLKALKDCHGVNDTRALWTTFLEQVKIDAEYWKDLCIKNDFIDALESAVLCIGKEGITTTEQEDIVRIISIGLHSYVAIKEYNEAFDCENNDDILRKLTSLTKDSIETFGQPFVSAFLPVLPLLIKLIYSFEWSPEFIPYLMENALGNARDGQEMKTVLSCFRSTATNTIEYLRPHLITLITCCEKNLDHPSSDVRSESMELLKIMLSKQWIKKVMENLGMTRLTSLCDKLLKATETEEEFADTLNTIIASVADFRMEANLKWYKLLVFIKEASTNNNSNLNNTAISVLRCVPSLVMFKGDFIANSIKDILLTCIQNGHYEEALETFLVLAKECLKMGDKWMIRSLSDMIPTFQTDIEKTAHSADSSDSDSDSEMEFDLQWIMLQVFIEKASSSGDHNMKETAIRCAPSLVKGEGDSIVNSIKDSLLTCIQNGHSEEALKAFSDLAKESETNDDEWIMRSLSDMIPTLLTMASCALETGEYDISDIEKVVDILVEMLPRTMINPYLHSILSLCKTALDTARRGQPGPVSKQLGVLAVTAARHIFTKMGSMTARAVNEPWCALGSHSIEVGDLEVEKDNNATSVRKYASCSFKRLDPARSSFACVYSLFSSIDKMKPTEGSCLLMFIQAHGCTLNGGDIMIEPFEGQHKCEGYKGLSCDTTKNGGRALPIYLTDVIYHMSQHLKELDREENRGVKSVAIISPVICLAEQNVLVEKRTYNFNKLSTDNVCLILNSDNEKILKVNTREDDPTRLVPLETLATHKTIREGLDALKNVENGNHGKFRVFMDRGWIHSRAGEEFVPDNEEITNFHNFVMGKGNTEENIYLSSLFDSDLNAVYASDDITQDSNSYHYERDDNSDDSSHLFNNIEDRSLIVPRLVEKLKDNDSRIRSNVLLELELHMHRAATIPSLVPTVIGLVETALKRREDFAEIRYGLSLLLSITDKSHLPALLELCHTTLESTWIGQGVDEDMETLYWRKSIRTDAAELAQIARVKMNTIMAINVLTAHPADKSAFVPLSLSSSDVISEEIDVDVADDVFNQEVSIFGTVQADKSAFVLSDLPLEDVNVEIGDAISSEVLNCKEGDNSAFVVSSSHEGISDDVCVDDHIFGKEVYEGSVAVVSTHTPDVTTPPQSPMPIMVVELAFNDLPADKSAFVPPSLSSSDVHSEDMEIDIFNQTHSSFQADKSAYVPSPTLDEITEEMAINDGEMRANVDTTSSLAQV